MALKTQTDTWKESELNNNIVHYIRASRIYGLQQM